MKSIAYMTRETATPTSPTCRDFDGERVALEDRSQGTVPVLADVSLDGVAKGHRNIPKCG